MVIWHLKQTGKVKKLCKWVPYELTANKNSISQSSATVTCNKKWILHNWRWPAQWLDGEAAKHFQSQTCTKRRSWSLFGGLLPAWPTTAFWILVKPFHLKSTLSRSMRYSENRNACSLHQSAERAQFFPTTTPDYTSHNQRFKSWMNWATKFCLFYHIHLTSRQTTILGRQNAPITRRRQEKLSKCLLNPKAWIFMLQEQANLFLIGKNVLIVIIPILIKKNVWAQ